MNHVKDQSFSLDYKPRFVLLRNSSKTSESLSSEHVIIIQAPEFTRYVPRSKHRASSRPVASLIDYL